jgi:hypothetical protein
VVDGGLKENVKWNLERRSLPNKGVGQEGRIRKECVKGKPSIWHEFGPVTFGWWRRPATPTMEICEGKSLPEK